ncbi:uncharacterized protein LOC127704929 [Mytilus californianus]|uniref:uncharacterized protein LOC127704929 n=1 Tax=Mytilus californianus TaxID=6549 RepID=UPI00224831BA|nr:uncharacterized protein LOC127704929 [Mytilus californianus]
MNIIVEKNSPNIPGVLKRMAGASNIHVQRCEPCNRDGENQKAVSCCSDCIEYLCVECAKFHRKGKITANHKTISILEAEKVDSSILDIPEICNIHEDQKLSFFCVQHDTICCAFCLRELHSACKDVRSMEKASKGVRTGTSIEDLKRRMSDFSLIIGRIVEAYKNNLSLVSVQKDECKEKLRNIRKELIGFLDELEQVIDKKVDVLDKECKDQIEQNIKDLTTRKIKSETWQTAIKTLAEHASETRILAAVKTLDLLQGEEEAFLDKFQEKLTAYEIRSSSYDFIGKIKPILAKISGIKIEKSKTTVPGPLNGQQDHTYHFQQGKVLLDQKISCSQLKITRIYSACFTLDNRIVFSCHFLISMYDIASASVQSTQVKYCPLDITCDLKNDIYASFPAVGLCKINKENFTEDPWFTQTSGCFNCVKVNNDTIYSNTNSREVIVLNEDQTIVKSLKTKIKLEFMCMEGHNGIFISDGKSIKHMTESGSISRIPYTLKRDNEITGLDVDEKGQLYACTSNKEVGSIVRINTTTGYKEPVLENLVTPRDIAFHPTKNKFLVMTDHGKECSVYEVTN